MKTLRVGVIGLGMGRNHVEGYQAHPAVNVVAIADTDQERLKTIGDAKNIPGRYTSAQAMLAKEKLDIVSVVTPNAFHKPLTLEALAAGCHVLCEKPMAMNTGEAEAMLAAAQKAGRRLMINFSFRFNPQSWALKKEVQEGALGSIYFGRSVWHRRRGMPGFGGWFGTKALSGGGPLIDLGVHRLDQALWLMDYPEPDWVMGRTFNHLGTARAEREGKTFDVEDCAVGMITFKNGSALEIESSWAANISESELMETRLLGTRGGLVQRNVGGGYQFEAELYEEHNGSHYDRKLMLPNGHPPHPAAHFVDAILNDEPHIATGEEGVVVMRLLDALYESARSRQPVSVA